MTDPERSALDEASSDHGEDVVEFDQHGIPVTVGHTVSGVVPVWTYIHKLDNNQAYRNKTFTHVCTVCTRDVATRKGPVDAWKTGLVTTVNTSNAHKHMTNAHKTHPFSVDYMKAKLEKAVKRVADFDAGQDAAPPKKRMTQPTLQTTIAKAARDDGTILASRWLIANGLAFNIIDNDQFRTFVASLGGKAPTRASYNEITDADSDDDDDIDDASLNMRAVSVDAGAGDRAEDMLATEATKVLDAWIALSIDWTTHTKANVMDAKGVAYDMWKLYKEVDVLKWFKDVGQVHFPSIAISARVYLAKLMSNAFQERVFSTVSNIVTAKRNAGDPARVGKLIVLKQKWTGDRPDTDAK
ncbi:hypothetical protein SDRG_04393 [Saprolegnia diclina VS20]|uniref:HAT C-terminal dimerisation domain-containing protein n=1 Tax=Saprolegnia diclina (strain VS20) TaxID=1156394 RepID=T0S153_SAPDV|nr:hypothetical protein SDRG_04393 [Saprolegnia diclina VS20]EQC38698.1 hypothetical protein SDRG_04393 [Saprolegnia diclina VS20]|eukprot:XP_008608290.1 hypothetical protein SDRG_04393 [Saprolegnia diclina VS20]